MSLRWIVITVLAVGIAPSAHAEWYVDCSVAARHLNGTVTRLGPFATLAEANECVARNPNYGFFVIPGGSDSKPIAKPVAVGPSVIEQTYTNLIVSSLTNGFAGRISGSDAMLGSLVGAAGLLSLGGSSSPTARVEAVDTRVVRQRQLEADGRKRAEDLARLRGKMLNVSNSQPLGLLLDDTPAADLERTGSVPGGAVGAPGTPKGSAGAQLLSVELESGRAAAVEGPISPRGPVESEMERVQEDAARVFETPGTPNGNLVFPSTQTAGASALAARVPLEGMQDPVIQNAIAHFEKLERLEADVRARIAELKANRSSGTGDPAAERAQLATLEMQVDLYDTDRARAKAQVGERLKALKLDWVDDPPPPAPQLTPNTKAAPGTAGK